VRPTKEKIKREVIRARHLIIDALLLETRRAARSRIADDVPSIEEENAALFGCGHESRTECSPRVGSASQVKAWAQGC
jgi:hypothetical protein